MTKYIYVLAGKKSCYIGTVTKKNRYLLNNVKKLIDKLSISFKFENAVYEHEKNFDLKIIEIIECDKNDVNKMKQKLLNKYKNKYIIINKYNPDYKIRIRKKPKIENIEFFIYDIVENNLKVWANLLHDAIQYNIEYDEEKDKINLNLIGCKTVKCKGCSLATERKMLNINVNQIKSKKWKIPYKKIKSLAEKHNLQMKYAIQIMKQLGYQLKTKNNNKYFLHINPIRKK